MLTDHTLLHDLEYAAARGVQVRVILERAPYGSDVSSSTINHAAYDQLYAAGIPVHWSSSRFLLTHEKTMIIDGATAYILTLNFTKAAFTANREFAIVDRTGEDVREAAAAFEADWRDVPYRPHDPNLLISPTNSRARLLALLRRAHRSVEIDAEEVQDSGIEAALRALGRRGVLVRIITSTNPAQSANLRRLQESGVRLHYLASPYIHAKLVLVDGTWAFVGSENISAASLDSNRELGVLVADKDSLLRLGACFNQDWAS